MSKKYLGVALGAICSIIILVTVLAVVLPTIRPHNPSTHITRPAAGNPTQVPFSGVIPSSHGKLAAATPTTTKTVTATPTATPLPPSINTGPAPGTATTHLTVSTATYLGGAGSGVAGSTDVAPDGTIVVGATLPSYSVPGVTTTTLLAGGPGVVARFDSTGRTLRSLTTLGNTVNEVALGNDGKIAACGDFGVVLLDSTASTALWSANPGNGGRCAIGADGTVAVLIAAPTTNRLFGGSVVYLYSASGATLAHWSLPGSFQADVAVDGTNHLLIATGFTNNPGPVQIAYLTAWSYAGTVVWSDYNDPLAQVNSTGLLADTRGYLVNIGRDGMLYYAGTSAGGNSIYNRDPKNIMTQLGGDRLIATDQYTTPYNTSSNNITWFGRYDPQTGNLLKGQFLLARNDAKGNKGNSITPQSITADEQGRIYLGGVSAYEIANRNGLTISGIAVAPYQGGDSYLLITSADLKTRVIWTTFTGPGTNGHSSNGISISERGGIAALSVTLKVGTMVTYNALQATVPSTTGCAYLVAWSQSGE